jgi:hypothetical protein
MFRRPHRDHADATVREERAASELGRLDEGDVSHPAPGSVSIDARCARLRIALVSVHEGRLNA